MTLITGLYTLKPYLVSESIRLYLKPHLLSDHVARFLIPTIG